MTINDFISSVQSSVDGTNLIAANASDHNRSLSVDSLQISTETAVINSDVVYCSDILRNIPVLFSDYLIKQLEIHIRTKSGHSPISPELIQQMNGEKRTFKSNLKTFLALHQSEWMTSSFEKQLFDFITKRLQSLDNLFGLTITGSSAALFCVLAFQKVFQEKKWLQPVDISFSAERTWNTVMIHLKTEAYETQKN